MNRVMTFQDELKTIEEELLALKQRPTVAPDMGFEVTTRTLSVGKHTITYQNGGFPVLSEFYSQNTITPASPSGNTQVIWVGGQSANPVTIISSRKVSSVS